MTLTNNDNSVDDGQARIEFEQNGKDQEIKARIAK